MSDERKDLLETIVECFYYGTNMPPVHFAETDDAEFVEPFMAWLKTKDPELHGESEGYDDDTETFERWLLDEDNLELIAEFFVTMPDEKLCIGFKEMIDWMTNPDRWGHVRNVPDANDEQKYLDELLDDMEKFIAKFGG
ncbi:MAG: hypothetical protein HKM24_04675 [Gammaproteobacteria bacterium]|nr:hypothetical protein [Gammaproteobacteria bacterium]